MINTSSTQRHQSLFSYLTTYLKYGIVGAKIRLEASTACQLKCPLCPTGRGEMGVLGRGYLKFTDFKKFIEQYPFIQEVEISNYGEIFLNPELSEILQYAYEKNIRLTAFGGVNLNNAKDDVLEALVKYRFWEMTVALDGASADTYKIYRQRGNFDNVIANVRRINFYKEKHQSFYPVLRWQFILFGHTEQEISKAKELAKELNMKFILRQNWNSSYSPVKNRQFVNDQVALEKKSVLTAEINQSEPYCKQLWLNPQINWDGKLVGCCVNNSVDFGNVFQEGLDKCLKGKDYRYMKEMLLGLKEPRKDLPCYNCGEFRDRKKVYKQLRTFRNPLSLLWAYSPAGRLNFENSRSLKEIGIIIDRNIGKVGIFLKRYFPAVYNALAKIIKKK